MSLGQCVAQCPSCVDPHSSHNGYSVKTYHESSEHVENPHRGFVHQEGTDFSHHRPLTKSTLDRHRQQDGTSMVWRTFTMDTFVKSAISNDFLNKIRHDLDVVESASFTAVLRFCYTFSFHDPPYGDASKNIVLQHIQQLKPIFHQYERVITSVEAGFIGTWGEWYYTDHFGMPEWHTAGHDPVTGYMPQALNDRKQVLLALLHATPKSIQVQVRYPAQKMHMMGSNHNDCFLSSDNDVGTYRDKAVEYPYLEKDTRYTIMGGETCKLTNNHRHECPTALKEMAMFHWTFLNKGYLNDMYDVWRGRAVMTRSTGGLAILPNTVRINDNLCFHLEFTNTGFAAPVKVFNLFFILQSSSGGHYYAAKIPGVEVRDWQPGATRTVSTAVHVGQSIPQGQYKVLVALSDRLLGDRADYNVLLANSGVPALHTGTERSPSHHL
ncbi:hypothetical protein BaRGS_00019484, partial [Batillaria attramentaria]